jgi:hypothetical protein
MPSSAKDRDEQQDRWRDLAAELGLPPEPEPAPLPAPVTTSKPDFRPLPEEELLEPEEEGPTARTEHADELDLEEDMEPAGEMGAIQEIAPVAEEEEEQPSRHRRRSRRGMRRHEEAHPANETSDLAREDEDVHASHQAADQDEPADETEEPEEKPQRRRRRSRQRSRPEPQSEADDTFDEEDREEEAEPEAEEPAEDVHEDDDEPDNLADWNVPSWQELIASLYRPER